MPYRLSYRSNVPHQIAALAGQDLQDVETYTDAVGIRDASAYGEWIEITYIRNEK
jgi:hypothetical protein